jgi:alanyl-tRNA synthetase
MKTDILRERFLSFFKKKDHRILPSAPLVLKDDPTLLFTSAGMNQFKEEFRGNVGDFARAATCQKCLRTDDLSKIGKTPAHHTFFEMLGNFSFGDYFKKEAIFWAFEFLTKILNLPKDKLWVSVYKEDEEAFNYWFKMIGVPKERIVKLGEVENFWPSDAIRKGPNGPCGPCSEIFYDRGKGIGCKKDDCSPVCNCERFVEVWNLVFTQFERKEGGTLEPLPNKNIDTGMGLERMASVLQGVLTNFEIDILRPIVDFICEETKTDYGADLNKRSDIYCICDHIRAITFAICENVLPSNIERGYIIRKLIRKSSMHARNLLKEQGPFLYKLVPLVAKVMQVPYPELKKRQENISQIILSEERRFQELLENAESLIVSKFSQKKAIDTGRIAFELYDTFGMPLEITKKLAKELFDIEIDEESFNEYMSRQINLSKTSSQMKGEVFAEGKMKMLSGIKKTEFLGYKTLEVEAEVLLILEGEQKKEMFELVSRRSHGRGKKGSIVLDKSSFYGERGGQAGDRGEILGDDFVFRVENTLIYNDIILHEGEIEKGKIKIGDKVLAKVDKKRRLGLAKHHTTTHLLQSALRKVLGSHVEQAGSFVEEDRLRFDFTHFKALDEKQLQMIEDLVNEYITRNYKVEAKILSREEALRLGAIALFGEKYGQVVRVIIINEISKELCGGTHLNFTGEAGLFKINRENAISAGVRRIEAVCGESAYKKIEEREEMLKEVSLSLGIGTRVIEEEVKKLNNKLKKIKKEIVQFRDKNVGEKIFDITKGAKGILGTNLIIKKFSGLSPESLRIICDNIEKGLNSYVVILFSKLENKITLVVTISEDNITKGLNAHQLIRDIALKLKGSGGGRADFAQAGAKDNAKLDEIISNLPEIIRRHLK